MTQIGVSQKYASKSKDAVSFPIEVNDFLMILVMEQEGLIA